jgi:Raf kinase inhibitor-like YbhB/YbcL family protein
MRHWLLALVVILVCAVQAAASKAPPRATFTLTSPAFTNGAPIPAKHAQRGENSNPALRWRHAPKGTRSFALIVEDPDAPRGTWIHWVLYNIPAGTTAIPDGCKATTCAIPAWRVGTNSGGHTRYDGPAPPSGTHRYFFRLYALNTATLPNLKAGDTAADVRKAMRGHLLGTATLMGRYRAGSK